MQHMFQTKVKEIYEENLIYFNTMDSIDDPTISIKNEILKITLPSPFPSVEF